MVYDKPSPGVSDTLVAKISMTVPTRHMFPNVAQVTCPLLHIIGTYRKNEMNHTVEGNEDDEDEGGPLRGTHQFQPKEDGSDAKNLGTVANQPVEPVEYRPSLVVRTAPTQSHEWLDETQA